MAFWALYGQGFTSSNLIAISSFGGAYLSVILLEPLVDLAVLALAKRAASLQGQPFLERRLYQSA